MAHYISKPDYSKIKGFQELAIFLGDGTESAQIEWTACKFITNEKTSDVICLGKAKSVSGIDNDKLPEFLYVTFHQKEYTYKKAATQPSQFELWTAEIAKPFLESGEMLSGKMMLSPGMSASIDIVRQFIALKPTTTDIVLPNIEISGFGGTNQKSFGMKPEEKLCLIAKQLKIEEPEKATLFDIAVVIDVNYKEQKETMLRLIAAIL